MAELVDALDLGSSGVTRGSSSLPSRTNVICLATLVTLAIGDFLSLWRRVSGGGLCYALPISYRL